MGLDRKVAAKVRRLKEKAFKLLTQTKYDKAVDVYAQLAELDPSDGEWPRRAADCHWHLKNTDQRLRYSILAAKAYSESRLMLKAIAMCKVVLSIDPDHKETQERLARLHSVRPPKPRHQQPAGVKRHGGANPIAALQAGRARLQGKRPSPQPVADETKAKNAEKKRARMAAAAALRQARAQKRKRDIETSHKVSAPATSPPAEKPPTPQEKVLGRVALKPVIKESPKPFSAPIKGPPSSAFPDAPEPQIPSLRLDPVPDSQLGPALDEMQLSRRFPAKTRDSAPPARGNVYSLTLEDVPVAELHTGQIPEFAEPTELADHSAPVPVIEPDSAPPHSSLLPSHPPGTPTPVDSLVPSHLGLHDDLAEDRASVAQKNFGHIPLLSDLDPEVLRQLITDVAMVELETNEVLFNEGDPADAMYVVVEGSVTAVTLPYGDRPFELAHLGEGEFFGEIGLMSDQPRQATITAHEPCRLLRFDRDIVAVLVDQDPSFLATLLQFLKDRLVEQLMMSSPLFEPFSDDERYELAEQFEFLEIEPNSTLLTEGQHPIGMYVLLTGAALMKGASEAGTVRKLGSGDIFGEQALLANKVSEVEVKTSHKCFALCLPADAFPEVIMTHPTVLEYLTTLSENSKGELDVADDFLDRIKFF